MLELITDLLALAILLGPIAAFALCKRTAAHANDPRDIVGGLLVAAHVLWLGLAVTLHLVLQTIFPTWVAAAIQAMVIVFIEYAVWRRAIRHSRCEERLASVISKLRAR